MDWQELYISALFKLRDQQKKIEMLEEIIRVSLPIVDENEEA